MKLARWQPRDVLDVQREVNRMFNSFWTRWEGDRNAWENAEGYPPLDVSETDDEVKVEAELPGTSRDEIRLSVTGNVLTIQGEKKHEAEKKEANYHRVERSYGSFSRSLILPANVNAEKISAQYKDGVLSLSLPKTEESKPKQIEIK